MNPLIPISLAAIAGGFFICTLGPRQSVCHTEIQIRREAEYRQGRTYRDQGNRMMALDAAEHADATTRRLIRERGDTICGEHSALPGPGVGIAAAAGQHLPGS